jgi:hypothetical protein
MRVNNDRPKSRELVWNSHRSRAGLTVVAGGFEGAGSQRETADTGDSDDQYSCIEHESYYELHTIKFMTFGLEAVCADTIPTKDSLASDQGAVRILIFSFPFWDSSDSDSLLANVQSIRTSD